MMIKFVQYEVRRRLNRRQNLGIFTNKISQQIYMATFVHEARPSFPGRCSEKRRAQTQMHMRINIRTTDSVYQKKNWHETFSRLARADADVGQSKIIAKAAKESPAARAYIIPFDKF